MPPTTRGARSARHLSLAAPLETAPPRLSGERPPLSLRGAPYRPGELLTALPVRLTEDLAERANRQARRHRVPVELWIRASRSTA